jgi:hypothetical protein
MTRTASVDRLYGIVCFSVYTQNGAAPVNKNGISSPIVLETGLDLSNESFNFKLHAK